MWVDGMETFRWHPYRGAVRLRFYSRACYNRRYRYAQPPATSCDAFGIGVLAIRFRWYRYAQPPAISCDAFGIGVLAIRFRRYRYAQPPASLACILVRCIRWHSYCSSRLYTYITIKVIFKVCICWPRIRRSANILPPFCLP